MVTNIINFIAARCLYTANIFTTFVIMVLAKFIQELLYQHECVTVPSFGAFLTRTVEARIVNGAFSPPQKEVTFNRLLVANDGVLAHYFAKRNKISYEMALRTIEKEVSSWKKRLNTQTLRFPGVGEMHLNEEKKLVFSPWGKVNFDLLSYGLKAFHRNPIKEVPHFKETKIISIMSEANNNEEDLIFTPEPKDPPKENNSLRYAIIGIAGIALLAVAYYFSDQYVTTQRIEQQNLAQQQIKSNVQQASFDLGSISTVDVAVNANVTPENAGPVVDKTYYSVIAGSFRDLENAQQKIASLAEEGFQSALAQSSPDGLYRAAYGRFATKREAINLLYFIKYTLKEEAWYLVEQ